MAVTIAIKSARHADDADLSLTLDAPRIVIGRGQSCELQLPDPTVSARHASIRRQDGRTVILDEGSTNGVVVGGARLPPHTAQVLRDGQLVRVGRCWLQIHLGAAPADTTAAAATPARRARALATELLSRELRAQGEQLTPYLAVEVGPDAGRRLELVEAGREYLVGRGRDADLVLTDDLASRRHVAVQRQGGGCWLRDLGSKRGSLLAGASLGSEAVEWTPGSPLALGRSELRFCSPIAEALSELVASADVRMRPDELHESPPTTAAPSDGHGDEDVAPPADETPLPSDPSAARSGTDATLAVEPGGCASLDVLVVLMALAVLGLSIVGLLWVLR